MRKKLTLPSEEILLGTKANSMAISRSVKQRELKKIGPRLYTSNMGDAPEKIVRRNLLQIIGLLFPGAVVSHRSALEVMPTNDGQFFLTYKHSRKFKLPGVTLNLLEGPRSTSGASFFPSSLYISGRARAFMENLQASKKKGRRSQKCLPFETIEKKLDDLCRVHGEAHLNQLRNEAKQLAHKLGMKREFEKLNSLISTMLATGPVRVLKTSQGKARRAGESYDPIRIDRFEVLYRYLLSHEYPHLVRGYNGDEEFETQAFFEAYFSNYIEGTRFPVDEARSIVFDGKIPQNRPDAHDIIGTYKLIVNKSEIATLPRDGEHFLDLLKHRHKTMMKAHPAALPGQFKEARNQAGSTLFVEPEAVRGTLKRGLEFCFLLRDPLKEALFMMFLVSEVHLFADGNGRLARLMMNSILFANNMEKNHRTKCVSRRLFGSTEEADAK